MEELPVFLKVVDGYTNKAVRAFLVATDPFSNQDKVQTLVKDFGVKCGVLLDPYKVACKKFDVTSTPRTFVVSPTGRFVADIPKSEHFENDLRNAIEAAHE